MSQELITSIKNMVKNDLAHIVERFNKSLHSWEEAFGCKANFSWKYDSNGKKFLEIKDINMPISQEETSEERLKEVETIFTQAPDIKF
jgi:Holliday junction resolvase